MKIVKRSLLCLFGLVGVVLVSFPLRATDFIRGDANGDGVISISDAHFINAFLFVGGPTPECGNSADTDDNNYVQLTDAVRILGYTFLGQKPPVAPFPSA